MVPRSEFFKSNCSLSAAIALTLKCRCLFLPRMLWAIMSDVKAHSLKPDEQLSILDTVVSYLQIHSIT